MKPLLLSLLCMVSLGAAGQPCGLKREVSRVDNYTRYTTPNGIGAFFKPLALSKYIQIDGSVRYIMTLSVYSPSVEIGRQRATVLLADGRRFSYEAELDIVPDEHGYYVSASTEVDLPTVQMLSTTPATDVKIGSVEKAVKRLTAERFQAMADCIQGVK